MKAKTLPYDPAASLTAPEAIEYFVKDAMEDDDPSYIAHALGIAARAKGMTKVASDTGLAREALYRSFSEDGNPSLKSTVAVLKSLGIGLTIRRLGEATSQTETPEAAE
ncbi:MAG: putative addiction module antidote protein [Rhizobium sp.]|nr:putative addiction module antidote protein [Rhizobium sp.]